MAATHEPALSAPPDLPGLAAPPHNLEAEMSVLGAILISDRTLYALVIEEGLKPEDFYRERHPLIYDAMLRPPAPPPHLRPGAPPLPRGGADRRPHRHRAAQAARPARRRRRRELGRRAGGGRPPRGQPPPPTPQCPPE